MVMVVIPKNVQIWLRIKTSRKYKLFCGRYSNALKRRQIKSPRNRKWIKILLSRKDIGHVCVVLVELQWAPGIVSASIQRAVSCIEIFFGFRIYTVCIQLLNFLCVFTAPAKPEDPTVVATGEPAAFNVAYNFGVGGGWTHEFKVFYRKKGEKRWK